LIPGYPGNDPNGMIPEMDDTGGRHRWMSLRGKAKTDGPSFAEIDGSDGRVPENEG